MEYITIQDAAERWGISERRIQVLCSEGRLKGAVKFGRQCQSPAILINPTIEKRAGGQFSLVRAGDPPGFPPAHGRP